MDLRFFYHNRRFSLPNILILIVCIGVVSAYLISWFARIDVQPWEPEDLFVNADNVSSNGFYHSPEVFRQNYGEMLKRFKVYTYSDGDPETFYHTPRKLTGKYSSEGYFFENIRQLFVTHDPDKADLFFIPISCHKMIGKGTSYANMTLIVKNYVESLISKYPYWNRTLGADHFFVTCHDVGVKATEGVEHLQMNSIRVLCSSSYDTGFIPHKDVALPQVLLPFGLPAGGNEHLKNRTKLGFWVGHRNSDIRVILAREWGNDTELDISNNRINRPRGVLPYLHVFYNYKFCICPGGSQPNNARIATSIHYGCVPVILSNYYDLPFNSILNWRKFAVVLKEEDVYQLKQILKNITQAEFHALHNNLIRVQKHFRWNSPPVQYDAFHMVMYELWLRRHVIRH